MRINRLNLFQRNARSNCQTVLDFDLIHSSNIAVILSEQVICWRDRTAGTIVDRQHPKFDFAPFHCLKDVLKGGVESDSSAREELLGSRFGVCPICSLTADFLGSRKIRNGENGVDFHFG